MQIDDFLGLVRRRRSIRRFKLDPIPDEAIDKILEAARWAMSGANAQPWEFIVVKDPEMKERIAQSQLEVRREGYWIEQTRVQEVRHPQLLNAPLSPELKDAPVLIVVCGDKRTFQATVLSSNFLNGEGGPGGTYVKNLANATHNMHLAAAALGLGSQWKSVNHVWEQALKRLLNVPDMIEIHTIVVLGYPAYEPLPAYRRELKEMVHYERYDRMKYRSGEDMYQFLCSLRRKTRPSYAQEMAPGKKKGG